ncbi:DoxX family protein [Streptomyces sp. NPDC020792]|uniref:DoxX family protein n=1 Tax=Streptomyces sp. NPDC020792 TaxID=3365089 RepID=UPI003787AE19
MPVPTRRVRDVGSRDTAALLLRFTLGPMLFAHGWNKVRGPGGLKGTTGWFEALGLKPAALHAKVAAGTEMVAGAALTVGAGGPLPAAATVGLMAATARTDHRGKGFFVFKGGWEYTSVVVGAAVALAVLGHGRYSLDALEGRQSYGTKAALLTAALGAAGSAALLTLCYRPDQEESGTEPADEE